MFQESSGHGDHARRFYERHPVLVDRSGGWGAVSTWPVRHLRTMFDMTNDSHLFMTASQLEAEGFLPCSMDNRWKRGEEVVSATLSRAEDDTGSSTTGQTHFSYQSRRI